jgi:hypothetical protein
LKIFSAFSSNNLQVSQKGSNFAPFFDGACSQGTLFGGMPTHWCERKTVLVLFKRKEML